MDITEEVPIPPQTVIGDYRVVSRFASGGMGDVYEVVNPLLREFFAMKVLREDSVPSASRREAVSRFLEEARLTVRLRHGNIVTLHTMGLEPTRGRLYFVMDYVGLTPRRRDEILGSGPWFSNHSATTGGISRVPLSLEDVLRVRGPLEESVVRVLAADVARALHCAHTFGEGIVHCDLKPANVLLRDDGHAVVSDFGIAKARYAAEGHERSGVILGTPDYMAPEQCDPSAPITPATDIYAFGVMLCRLLTGGFPVGIWTRPSELGLSLAWDALIERCIARDPTRRWPSMAALAKALRDLPSTTRRLRRKRALCRAIIGSVAVLFALGCVVVAIFLLRRDVSDARDIALHWEEAIPQKEAFVDCDLAAAHPVPEWAGVLAYDVSAPEMLPLPEAVLPHVSALALPRSTTGLPEGFVSRFPRLAYVACDPKNKIFFASDGILYRRDNPSVPALVPPRLSGHLKLPVEVTHFPHPWPTARVTATSLESVGTGAYDQSLFLESSHPVHWELLH